jgi:2,4-diaminopentanoate dehydrogenase
MNGGEIVQVYRVIQWATGNVGGYSLRALVENPRFQVVGAFAYSADKTGKDIGEISGIGPIGILATNDIEQILAINADCVVYNALGETWDPNKSLEDICRLLASGKNVVSTAVSRHIHPEALAPEDREKLELACKKGGTTFHSTGINPGFSFDILPISISALANRIDRINVTELVDMSAYTSESIVADVIGMGMTAETDAPIDLLSEVQFNPYITCLKLLSDSYGITFDDVRITREKAVTAVPVTLPWGQIQANTVAARKICIEASLNGKTCIVYDMVWRVSNDVAPHWPSGKAHYEIVITGDPLLRCRFDIESDTARGTSIGTAMQAVNAIAAVCAADPGIKTRLDLPLFAGGFFSAGT